MRVVTFLNLLAILVFGISGCSPVNSMQPFDQEQAAKLLHEHSPPGY